MISDQNFQITSILFTKKNLKYGKKAILNLNYFGNNICRAAGEFT